MSYQQVDIMWNSFPNQILFVLFILKGVAHEIGSIRRAKYSHTFNLNKFMLEINTSLLQFVYYLFSAKLNKTYITWHLYLLRQISFFFLRMQPLSRLISWLPEITILYLKFYKLSRYSQNLIKSSSRPQFVKSPACMKISPFMRAYILLSSWYCPCVSDTITMSNFFRLPSPASTLITVYLGNFYIVLQCIQYLFKYQEAFYYFLISQSIEMRILQKYIKDQGFQQYYIINTTHRLSSVIMSQKSSKLNKKTHKIIFLGDSGVGKTCIIQKFASNRFDDFFNPTIGVDFVSKDIKFKGGLCRFQLWDTAGQQKFKSLVPTYLRDAVCCIFVFDVSKKQSLKNIEEWINLFRENKKERAISIICGNKNDLQKNFDKEALQHLIEKYQMPYYCISAKTGNNIDELFFNVAEMLDKLQSEKSKKLKQTFCEDYQNPPLTIESFTRSQTKEHTVGVKDDEDKQKVGLTDKENKEWKNNCYC